MTEGALTLDRYTPSDRALLRNLELLYSHDFSEMMALTLKPDGHFLSDEQFAHFFLDTFAAFIIRLDGLPVGFALVDNKSQLTGNPNVFDVLQFFVLRGVRRHGVGARAAKMLWQLYPGNWEVRQIDENKAAQGFWRRTIHDYTQGQYTESTWQDEDGGGVVQRFTSPHIESTSTHHPYSNKRRIYRT